MTKDASAIGPGDTQDAWRILSEAASALEKLDSYGVDVGQVVELVRARKELRGIPVSVFNPDLGALESIVKYMREELLLGYDAIAALLGRNPGPIGVTYRRAKRKFSGRLDCSSEEVVPFSVLDSGNLSVLESVSMYLAQQGHDWHAIARLMRRHDKTIWTVLDRAKKKMKGVRAK